MPTEPPGSGERAQSYPWKWERDTKSPSTITAIKHLQAVVSSGRGSRNAPKKLLSLPRGIYTQNKGWIYTSKLVLHRTNSMAMSDWLKIIPNNEIQSWFDEIKSLGPSTIQNFIFKLWWNIFTCGEVRVRRSRDDNRTFCLIYVKEAIGYCNQIWRLLCDSVV